MGDNSRMENSYELCNTDDGPQDSQEPLTNMKLTRSSPSRSAFPTNKKVR